MDTETALSIIEEDYDDSEYEIVEDMVDDGHEKHDSTNYYSIVLRKSDNTFWKVSYTISYEDGLDEYSVYASEVEKKQVVTHLWTPKTKSTKERYDG